MCMRIYIYIMVLKKETQTQLGMLAKLISTFLDG
jgi:hypothetical protein